MWGYRRHTPSANDIACFLNRFFSRDCSRRSDQAEGFIYTEPQFLFDGTLLSPPSVG